jgi:hypothetical protein
MNWFQAPAAGQSRDPPLVETREIATEGIRDRHNAAVSMAIELDNLASPVHLTLLMSQSLICYGGYAPRSARLDYPPSL